MNQVLPIARDAARTLWRHKRLWVFGFFVAAGAGGGAHVDLPAGGASLLAGPVVGLLVAGAIAVLVGLALHVVSEGALIDAVREERRGNAPALGLSWRRGRSAAGRLLGLKLLTWIASSVVLGGAATPVVLGALEVLPLAVGVVLSVLLAVVAVPTAVSVYLAHEVGLRMVVLGRRGAVDGLRAGLRFLRGRLRFALTLLVADGVAQAVTALVALPFALVAFGVGFGVHAAAGLVPGLVVGGALGAPIAILVAGARGTFRSALWTHAFLDEHPASS